jgi:hypothetical protein
MSVNVKAWEAERISGLILVTVPSCKWTRTCHDWELHRMRIYLRQEKQIPVDTKLAIFQWLEQQEAAIDAIRDEQIRRAERNDRIEQTCMALMGLVGLGLVVTCFLLAGGVL